MDKSPDAFRTISEVAAGMDLPQHVLRFWETRFPQIKPLKRGGGRRYYRPDDIELLRAIKRLLYDHGFTIKGVQKMLREQGAQAVIRGADAPPVAFPEPAPRLPLEPHATQHEDQRIEPVIAFGAAPQAPEKNRAGLSGDEIAALKALLKDLREAERLLVQARPR